ncbi:MAG: hypothetical protein HOG69_00435 [Thaumarchaeota archaeon]|jgi:hypothetical protein|nr:hypothetical protein [Nitrososphaerota archaeon]
MKKKLPPSRMFSIQSFDYQDFDSRIDDLRNYCKIIKKQKIKDQILMKNQLIVTLSTTLEVKLKEFISYLVDKWDIPAKDLFSERSIEIKLEVLDHLDKSSSNITKGKIIAAHLENLNPWVVQDIMNRINKLYYFEWFDDLITNSNSLNLLIDLNTERNLIVHELGDTNKSVEYLDDTIIIISKIYSLMMALTQFNWEFSEKKLTTSKINDYYESHLEKDLQIPFKTYQKKLQNAKRNYVPQKPYFKK